MTERLSDDELRAAVEDFRAMIAGDPDAGYALTNGDVLRLLEELVAAREREAAGYDVYQPVYRMADGSFGFGDDMECPTRELAEYHVHRDSPWDFVVRQRRGPWEPVTGGDDDG